ncbi:MAG TPA: MgtC/SapB family protein [Clostridia bacterium]|nr:MgtC/SapB family protein [Clostridia bacterium]
MIAGIKFTSIELDYFGDNLLDWLIRILIAAACGFAIGFERKTRSKEAGIRTHTIVALSSALMMIISKYGFLDLAEWGVGKSYDGARMAAQVVTGVGFLGAGMIFYRRDQLHGLTTAAGIWATAGIGMAAGAGMPIIAGVVTTMMVIMQVILHRPMRITRGRVVTILKMTVILENSETVDRIKYVFNADKFLKFKTTNSGDGLNAEIELITHKDFSDNEIFEIAKAESFIKTLEKTDEI